MKLSHLTLACAAAAALGTLLALDTTAQPGASESFTFQARVTENDIPRSGPLDVRFEIHDVADGESVLWSEEHLGLQLTRGLLSVQLGLKEPLLGTNAFGGGLGGDRFVAVKLLPSGVEIVRPRVKLTAVPYALTAKSMVGGTIAGDLTITGSLTVESGIEVKGDLTIGNQTPVRMVLNEAGSALYPTRNGAIRLQGTDGVQVVGDGNTLTITAPLPMESLIASNYTARMVWEGEEVWGSGADADGYLPAQGYSTTIPAELVDDEGETILVEAWGRCPADAAHAVRVMFGPFPLDADQTVNGRGWALRCRIVRVSDSEFSACFMVFGSAADRECDIKVFRNLGVPTGDIPLSFVANPPRIGDPGAAFWIDGWVVSHIRG